MPRNMTLSGRYANRSDKWTPEDEERLVAMRDGGMSWTEIGEKLKRTAAACESRYKAMMWGPAAKPVYVDPWCIKVDFGAHDVKERPDRRKPPSRATMLPGAQSSVTWAAR